MAFLDKLGELARTAADKANDGLEINRINSDIVIQKGNINEYQRELGMYYWAKFVMGDQLDEEATAICDKIVKAQDRIKELYWEGDGFLLLYKRLENGAFQWPRNKDEVRQLTPQQYRWLMEGLKTEQPKANKAVSGLSIL